MILCYGTDDEDAADYGWFQAGQLGTLGMIGLVEAVKRLLAEAA